MKAKLDYLRDKGFDVRMAPDDVAYICNKIYDKYTVSGYSDKEISQQLDAATYGYNLGFEAALDKLIQAIS